MEDLVDHNTGFENYLHQMTLLHQTMGTLSLDGLLDTPLLSTHVYPRYGHPFDRDPSPAVITIEQITPATPLYIEEFLEHSAVAGIRKATAMRAWNTGRSEQALYWHRQHPEIKVSIPINRILGPDVIDLDLLVSGMRAYEAGDFELRGFGVQSWNVFTAIINERLAEPNTETPLVLPWHQDVHPRLRSAIPGNRYYTAQKLEKMYQQMQAEPAASEA